MILADSIRFGANTASEDETDLSKVSLDLDLYRAYADGFLRGCAGRLTADEIALLPHWCANDDAGMRDAFPDRLPRGGHLLSDQPSFAQP